MRVKLVNELHRTRSPSTTTACTRLGRRSTTAPRRSRSRESRPGTDDLRVFARRRARTGTTARGAAARRRSQGCSSSRTRTTSGNRFIRPTRRSCSTSGTGTVIDLWEIKSVAPETPEDVQTGVVNGIVSKNTSGTNEGCGPRLPRARAPSRRAIKPAARCARARAAMSSTSARTHVLRLCARASTTRSRLDRAAQPDRHRQGRHARLAAEDVQDQSARGRAVRRAVHARSRRVTTRFCSATVHGDAGHLHRGEQKSSTHTTNETPITATGTRRCAARRRRGAGEHADHVATQSLPRDLPYAAIVDRRPRRT